MGERGPWASKEERDGVVCVLVAQSCPALCNPIDYSLPYILCPWGFSRQEYWSGLPCPPPGVLPNPGIKPRSLALQADSLPTEPPGKPRNTGMGSLTLFRGSFQPRNQTGVSCIAGGFFTSWTGAIIHTSISNFPSAILHPLPFFHLSTLWTLVSPAWRLKREVSDVAEPWADLHPETCLCFCEPFLFLFLYEPSLSLP